MQTAGGLVPKPYLAHVLQIPVNALEPLQASQLVPFHIYNNRVPFCEATYINTQKYSSKRTRRSG